MLHFKQESNRWSYISSVSNHHDTCTALQVSLWEGVNQPWCERGDYLWKICMINGWILAWNATFQLKKIQKCGTIVPAGRLSPPPVQALKLVSEEVFYIQIVTSVLRRRVIVGRICRNLKVEVNLHKHDRWRALLTEIKKVKQWRSELLWKCRDNAWWSAR